MTIHLCTFSDESMSRAAQLCIESAARKGGVDDSLRWYHEDLKRTRFYSDNVDILGQSRGLGFWAWKPWIIAQAMDNHLNERQFIENSITKVKDGDILIYSDAGVEFINNVNYIIDRMGHDKPQDDIWLFGNNWEHAHWCKRDVVEEIWPSNRVEARIMLSSMPIEERVHYDYESAYNLATWARFSKQCQASVIFFRVSDYTRQFVAEWLKWCLFEGGRLIDDSPSRAPNHPEFREHRHDQAILTTLAYREGIKLHAWPAVYNRFLGQEFVYSRDGYPASDNYPSLFHHHRLRNSEFDALGVAI